MGGSCTAGSSLLKAWLSWFRGGVLLRLFGLPCALLALHLEIYGSSPTTTTLILHRLSRRLRLSSFVCMFRKGHASAKVNSFFFFLGGADVMDCVVAPLSPEPSSPTSPRSPRSQRSSPRAGRRRRSTHYSLHKDQTTTTQTQPSPEQSGGDFRPQSPQPLPQTPSALPQTPAQPPRPHSASVSQSHAALPPRPPSPPSPPAPPTPSPPPSQPLPKPRTEAQPKVHTELQPQPKLHATEPQPKLHATEPQPKLHATEPQSKVHTKPQPTLHSEEPQPKLHSDPQPKPHIHVQAQAQAQAPAQVPPKPQPLPQVKQPLRTPRRPLPTPLPLSVATGSSSSAVSSRSRPSPSSSTLSPSLSASLIMNSHARSKSYADVNQGKRLSLQFPIQPSAGTNSPGFSPRNSPHNSRPQSWVATPSSAVTSPDVVPSPTEHNFLAILAAQERYVLELKEELAKAEEDLKTVKKHWATHQSVKQRNEHRKITQLQPLSATFPTIRPDQDDEDGSTMWMQKEMERRKALLSGQRTSQRKVFSGSRHLRTLSLLSPDKTYTLSFPQPADLRDPSPELPTRPQALARTATSPEIAQQIADQMKDDRYDLSALSNIQRDQLLRTGKRMATDFKDGLLTFIEDIRQATVGDEALDNEDDLLSSATKSASVNGTRKTSTGRPALARSGSSKKSTPRQSDDIADDFWKEHGLSEPKTAPTQKKTHPVKQNRTPQKPTKEEDFEEWDNWDTPNDKHNDHAAAESDSDESSEPSSPVSGQASSRTSTRYHSKRHDSKASSLTTNSSTGFDDAVLRDAKRNSIPWPDLVKLSPGNLKRTASHLMKEWEKNLTPPPESREGGHQSGDYIGRSASPAGWP